MRDDAAEDPHARPQEEALTEPYVVECENCGHPLEAFTPECSACGFDRREFQPGESGW